jgi:plastocyanin
MKKFILVILALLVVAAIFFALSWPKSTGDRVTLQFFSFHPGTLTINVGTTVTWTDKDLFAKHTVIGNGWGSGNLSNGGTFSFTFSQAGIYDYRCSHHFWMKGKIIVQ